MSSLSLYVISSLGCKITIWPSCGLCHLSACMWSPHLDEKSQSDNLTTCVMSQEVCDLLMWMQNHNLIILWPISSLSGYVISLLGCKITTWQSCHLCDLSGGMQFSQLDDNSQPWPSCGLCHLSAGMLSLHLDAKSSTDHLGPLLPVRLYVFSSVGSGVTCSLFFGSLISHRLCVICPCSHDIYSWQQCLFFNIRLYVMMCYSFHLAFW